MKLHSVETFLVRTPPPHLGGETWYFIKLTTDDGLVGWGETAVLSAFSGLGRSYETLVQEIFTKHLKGRNALEREAIFTTLYASILFQHSDYVLGGILSAFDLALWDIAGKFYNAPVYDLLGGRMRDRLRAYSYIYSTQRQFRSPGSLLWDMLDEAAEQAQIMVQEMGFTALKFDPITKINALGIPLPPWQLTPDILNHGEKAVRRMREAVGPDVDLLIGTHGQMTPSCARRLAARLEPYDPMWFEEPVPPDNVKEMGRVAAYTSIPIATGERLFSLFDFQKLFEAGACAIAQPDLGSCGGLTQAKKIATLAEANYVQMAPHIWGGPIITAAAIQLDACLPNFLIQESILDSRNFFDEIVVDPLEFDHGYLLVPDRPGLGIELDEQKLRRFAPNV